jgi:hypothetical protein
MGAKTIHRTGLAAAVPEGALVRQFKLMCYVLCYVV